MNTLTKFRRWVNRAFYNPVTPTEKGAFWFIVFLILASFFLVVGEVFSPNIFQYYKEEIYIFELFVVSVFSVEYLLKLWAAERKVSFIFSFYSLIDLISISSVFLLSSSITWIRILRLIRLFRIFRLFSYFGIREKDVNTVKIIQENLVKNALTIIAIFIVFPYVKVFVEAVPAEVLVDVLFVASILALAAMFAYFAFSYDHYDVNHTLMRLMAHTTSVILIFPIAIMFALIQVALAELVDLSKDQLWILYIAIWFVYGGMILFDFANVLRVSAQLTDTRVSNFNK